MTAPAARLRSLLEAPGLRVMPCCFDAWSARLIEMAGFPLTFMSGFAVSAARAALPDTGLVSYGEMLDAGREICAAVSLPVIGDADTGYGNPLNVKRTVHGYARAGFAAVMIEDQRWPKRCGHTRGKEVVARDEAVARIRAAAHARDEGAGILVLARTDARGPEGLDEALWRMAAFADAGADILFLEAPRSEEEMRRFCREARAPAMANLVEGGDTPILPPARLEEIGYKIAAHPLTLLSAATRAMQGALEALGRGEPCPDLVPFDELRRLVGFDAYDRDLARYGPVAGPAERSSRRR